MKLFRSITLVALMAFYAQAADIDGKWKGQLPGRDGNIREIAFDFKADGTTLSGSMKGFREDVPITDGKISGSEIQFKVSMKIGGSAFAISYQGVLADADLKMKMANENSPRSVEFLLKKQ